VTSTLAEWYESARGRGLGEDAAVEDVAKRLGMRADEARRLLRGAGVRFAGSHAAAEHPAEHRVQESYLQLRRRLGHDAATDRLVRQTGLHRKTIKKLVAPVRAELDQSVSQQPEPEVD
jgi:hypothetical protein